MLMASTGAISTVSPATAASSPITWVQGTYASPPSGNAASASLANVAAGDVLVASVNVGAGYVESGAPGGSGPAALVWTEIVSRTGSQSQLTLWYAAVAIAGNYTVSATATGPEIALALDEYAGVATSGTVVTSGSNAGHGKSPHAAVGTTAPAGSLVLGSFTWNSINAGVTAGSGFTLRQLYGNATQSQPVAVEDRTLVKNAKPGAAITLSSPGSWVAVVAALAPGSGSPRPTTGTVSGTVTSSGGTALGGATVTVGGTSLTATTASTGAYSIANVPAGTQSLTASLTGYSSQTQSVSVTAGATATLNFGLAATTNTAGRVSLGFDLAWDTASNIPWADLTEINLFGLQTTNGSALDTTSLGVNQVNVPQWVTTAHANHVLALITIGGIADQNWQYACSDTYRSAFVANLVNYMQTNGFDGIDLDIEDNTWAAQTPPVAAWDTCVQAIANAAHAVKTAAGARPIVSEDVTTNWMGSYVADDVPYIDQWNLMTYGDTCANNCASFASDVVDTINEGVTDSARFVVGVDVVDYPAQDTTATCSADAQYAVNSGLAGAMLWALQPDQTTGYACLSGFHQALP